MLLLACSACGRIGFSELPISDDASARSYALTILADQPVGYWRLGEPSGLVARDLSGHGNDGSYQGGVTLGRAGALVGDPDTATALDGTTGFVRIPYSASLNVLGVATAEGWVHGGTANGPQEVWSTWDGASGYQLIYNDGLAGAWSNAGIVMSSTVISDANWHHLVAVWNGPQGLVYVDAVLTGSGPVQLTAAQLESQIGTQCQAANSTTCNYYRTGDTDEVAVYDYALPAATIAAHYAAGLGMFP